MLAFPHCTGLNTPDDERNPPETRVMAEALWHSRNARLYLIPASTKTSGHGTTGNAGFWLAELASFLATVPNRPVM